MPVETLPLLVATGVMILAAFAANLFFQRFRVPDILLLIGLGVAMGPLLGILDVEGFEGVLPFVGALALIFILFDGGLEIKLKDLAGGALQGAKLAVVVFLLTATLCTAIGKLAAGLSLLNAALIGMAFGGAGVVIVIPLIQHMGVSQRAMTIVTVEAAISDVLVVIGVIGVATAAALRTLDPVHFARHLAEHFAIGVALGVAAGFLWARLLARLPPRGPVYLITLATLFLLYAAVEFLEGSGPLAVLLFGLVLGNSRKTRQFAAPVRSKGRKAPKPEGVPVFHEELSNFHRELVFFIRTLFFVSLGVVLDLSLFTQPQFVAAGLLFALAVGAARWWGVRMTLRKGSVASWDRLAVALMFPLGLAAAALSRVPHDRFGLPGAEVLGSYALVVIVLTNLLTTLLVAVLSQPAMRRRLTGIPDPARPP